MPRGVRCFCCRLEAGFLSLEFRWIGVCVGAAPDLVVDLVVAALEWWIGDMRAGLSVFRVGIVYRRVSGLSGSLQTENLIVVIGSYGVSEFFRA